MTLSRRKGLRTVGEPRLCRSRWWAGCTHAFRTQRKPIVEKAPVRDGMSSSRAPFTWRKVEHLGSHATRWSGLSHCGRCAVMVSADCGLAPCEYRDRNFDFNRPS